MNISEIILASSERGEMVKVPNLLFSKLITSYRCDDGVVCEVDFKHLESLYTLACDKRAKGRSRVVIYDHAQVFIDGKRIDGLTALQVALIEHLSIVGEASIDNLIDYVWKVPDMSKSAVYVLVSRLNEKLEETSKAYIDKPRSGNFSIKFKN